MTCPTCNLQNWIYHPMGLMECANCGHTIVLEITPRAPNEIGRSGGYSPATAARGSTKEGANHDRARKPTVRRSTNR